MAEDRAGAQARPQRRCRVEGCRRPYRAKGYCRTHYRKWRRREIGGKHRYRTCAREDCRRPAARRGLCAEHLAGERPAA